MQIKLLEHSAVELLLILATEKHSTVRTYRKPAAHAAPITSSSPTKLNCVSPQLAIARPAHMISTTVRVLQRAGSKRSSTAQNSVQISPPVCHCSEQQQQQQKQSVRRC
jgi:hypothetical protein